MTKVNCARVHYTIIITGSVALHHVDGIVLKEFCEDKLKRKFHEVLQDPEHGLLWDIEDGAIKVEVGTIDHFVVE